MLQCQGYLTIDRSIGGSLDDENDDENRNRDASNYHHHFIACKNYDKTITTIRQSSLAYSNHHHLKQEEEQEQELEQNPVNINKKTKTKKRVMVVDDEPDSCITFKKTLEDHGFAVGTYENSQQALHDFEAGVYDLVILDIKMPEISGFELYEKIKKIDSNIKVCFITALAEDSSSYDKFQRLHPELKQESLMIKPISMDDVARKINLMLDRS
jgi:CheY-like chemotaxis protein